MRHEEKVAAAIADLADKGVGRLTSAPPFFRLLWKIGLPMRPPHFMGFFTLACAMGVFFGAGWGAFMWIFMWKTQLMEPRLAIGFSLLAGLFFGVTMAAYYRWSARMLRLPPWSEYEKRIEPGVGANSGQSTGSA